MVELFEVLLFLPRRDVGFLLVGAVALALSVGYRT